VRAREQADFQESGMDENEHSEPQIYEGKAIGAQLKAWREQSR